MNFPQGEVLKVTFKDGNRIFYITKSTVKGIYNLYKDDGTSTPAKVVKNGASTPIEFDSILYDK